MARLFVQELMEILARLKVCSHHYSLCTVVLKFSDADYDAEDIDPEGEISLYDSVTQLTLTPGMYPIPSL